MRSFGVATPSAPCSRDPQRALRARPDSPAVRAIQHHLPHAIAAAVTEFLTGALLANPQRVGKPLRGHLAGIYSARRGTYPVLYRINDDQKEVVLLRIDHRRDVYRGS